MTRLVPITHLHPSTYNPRLVDSARLDLIALSLRKLGFLIPIYADHQGEILSGHQRHLVAERMGCTQLPVEYIPPMPLYERKAVNIIFNRATNDLKPYDTPDSLTDSITHSKVYELSQSLPDKDIHNSEFYRCLYPTTMMIDPLLKANRGRWVEYACSISKSLYAKGIVMPIIITPDLKVINGIGRLQMLAEKKKDKAKVIVITPEEAEFSHAMLNLLSMDFDIHTKYADLLRYNSFRRARRVRNELGRGFLFSIIGDRPAKEFDIRNPLDRNTWIQKHGTKVIDFGAGHLTETHLLWEAGIHVTPFEPYRLGANDQINKVESIQLAKDFLHEVASYQEWDSIFLSSVLNSVPFKEDREHMITICAALCSPWTKLYALASSDLQTGWRHTSGGDNLNSTDSGNIGFILTYEKRIRIGDISETPKVQKYHSPLEFRTLFTPFFYNVHVGRDNGGKNVWAICSRPKAISEARLQKAVEFEFNLPYPDGTRMDLINQAKQSFIERQKQRSAVNEAILFKGKKE